ncbi:MAG: ATP-binding protein [Merdibacter sp.]
MVENILENAQRYAQSVITIHLNEQEGLTIANDGPSMDESRIETLFKPFEKGRGRTLRPGPVHRGQGRPGNHYEVRGENTADGVIFRIYRDQPKKAKQKTERRSRQRGAKNNNEA